MKLSNIFLDKLKKLWPSAKKNNLDIPKEIRDKLPPGVKIKRIEITPQSIIKFILYTVLVFWVISTLRQLFLPQEISRVSLSNVIESIKKDEQKSITVSDNEVVVTLKDDKVLVSSKEPTTSMAEILQREGIDMSKVSFQVENRQGWKTFGEVLSLLLTVGLPILFIFWIFGRQTGGAGSIFGFGKSTAKLFIKGKQNMSFKDVAGVEEAKNDLVEVVDFLKHPEKYRKMGARAPKGVLLVGPSGVGKTLLAKAVAGEANVPFYAMAGSEFMEMLVGIGASRVRDLFSTAKKAGKAIIFIDEIDAIGRMRGGLEGGHSEREQTLNQILVEMDGFEANTAVVVLAATNRGDLLDPALLRPGRFDRRVVLELPDIESRKEILAIHARGKPFDKDVDWDAVARRTVGFSGADLENMLNESAIAAARNNKDKINFADVEEAALRVKMGAEKRRSQTDEDRLMTAYHEAGHAIVNYVEELDPVQRISIVSRGMALGFTLIPPKKDRVHETKSRLIKLMAMAMGGRAAEELVFGDITTGASSDISHATRIARDMVVEWGMSALGPVNLGPQIDVGNWGKTYMEPAKISDRMMSKVDTEIKKFINKAFERAQKVLLDNRENLDRIAKVLVEKESLGQMEFEALMVENPSV
ncbi:MAG: ATP-dependent zinc metalloprotease FtsH [Candidatus Shapirobacteria bacterium]|nr:ATP-dependent zinc metalloprotease FtsH [Candidatus Shapirobacteria bacterium]